ncbi:MAG: hypothetical protein WBA45_00320 [Microthrixaceae bacterium]
MSEFRVLMMCTANQCRSPMAEAIATAQLRELGVTTLVRSCGVLEGGYEAASGAVRAMKGRGLDISEHVSATLGADTVAAAHLVLAMERRHLTEIAGLDLDALGRAFTLKELAELATQVGYRRPGLSIESWIEQANRFREPSTVLSFDTGSDLKDPMGGPQRAFNRSADEITTLLDVVWSHLFPTTTT